MVDAGVPGSMEELIERYDRLIIWAIHRASRGLDDEAVQELRQKVYLRILQVDYLGRCRTYYATSTGRFTSSLTKLVSNVVYARHAATKTDPLALRAAGPGWSLPFEDADPPPATSSELFDLPVSSHERAIEARDVIAALGRRLDNPRSNVSIPRLLDAALVHGFHSKTLGKVLGANPSTVRFHIHRVRAEARRMTEGSWRSTTTKSASRSATSRQSSGAPTARPITPA